MLSNKKPLIDSYLDPLVGIFKHTHPNLLTLLGSIPSVLFFVFIVNGWYLAAIIAFIGTAFDAIDGMVARKYNKVTKFGGFLDSSFDRISDFLIIAAFGFGGVIRWEIVAPVILTSFLISYTRARAEQASPDTSFAVGLMERTERMITIIVGLILFMIFPEKIIFGLNLAEIVFVILLVLSLYTVIQRVNHAYKKL